MERAGCLLLAGAFVAFPVSGGAADAYKDVLCPNAAASVMEFNGANAARDAGKAAAAARHAIDAYRACATSALAVGNVEPAVNYDQVRIAQFEFALAQALAESGKDEEVVPLLRDARKLADEVAHWSPSATSYVNSNHVAGSSSSRNADRSGSNYQASAIAVRKAADDVLARLGEQSAPSASPHP